MRWELDPDFALLTRLSLGPRRAYLWSVAVLLTLLWLSNGSSDHLIMEVAYLIGPVVMIVVLKWSAKSHARTRS